MAELDKALGQHGIRLTFGTSATAGGPPGVADRDLSHPTTAAAAALLRR